MSAQSEPQAPTVKAPTFTGGDRLLWADCAKGMSIIAVCYMHVVTGVPGASETAWSWLNDVMDPVRMPMFFLVSGLFAHRVIERTLGDLWYRRLWFLLVPYLVFTPFVSATRLVIDDNFSVPTLLRTIIVGDPGVWFLYVLMVFNILACLTRRLPPLAAVALSVIPAFVVALTGMAGYNEITHITQYLPAFFLGLHFRAVFMRLATLAKDVRVIVAVAVLYIGWEWLHGTVADHLALGGWTASDDSVMSLMDLVRTVTAVPLAIVVAVWISWIPGIRRVFAAIGRNTLPIYVSHQIFLYLVNVRLLPWLAQYDPDTFGVVMELHQQVVLGLLTCALSGYVFYLLGKVPFIRWILYPPPLPRRPRRHPRVETD
ncbi:acyltransferase family protein [Candidatus Corynebacterium faecigallinarum]|uniref:acyltransferase family protein n=1 Tax=Candidatus Corynebacterium faecigallinarum TaxID=2838528 RepID=UPI003FD05009